MIGHILILLAVVVVARVFWRAGYLTGQAQRDIQWRRSLQIREESHVMPANVPAGTP